MSLIAGAYAAQPGELREQFYRGLGGLASLRGLELPYGPYGGSWPAGAPRDWSAVVTTIPGTMQRLAKLPTFGLASPDAAGRREALEFTAGVREFVLRLEDEGHTVEAVELHSAPYPGASAPRFRESLEEILGWEWGSTRLLVEHCDAPRAGRSPEKGFLALSEEVEVLLSLQAGAGGQVGMVINWARSVIETRNPETAAEHIAQARAAGVLAGVMFSGCSPVETEFGYPWIDAHLPPVEVDGAPASSLLDHSRLAECLAAAGPVPLLGFKIGLPAQGLTVSQRVDRLRQMGALVEGNQPR